MGRTKAQSKPKEGGRGHGIKKAKKVIQESSTVKSKKSLVTMLMKAKAKPEATLLTNGPLAVGDPVEVKESGVVHECRVVQVAEDLVQVHYQGWNARYDTWVRYPGSTRQALRDRTNKALEEIVPNLALKSKTKLNEASPKTIEMKDVEVKPEIKVKEEKKYVKTNPGLSEYELIRLENIRQREALFAELNLDAAKVEASPRIERTVSAPSRRGLQSEKKEKEVLPRRASTRLAGGSVKEIERYNPAPEPEARNDPEIAAKTLGLEEITDSDASSLLSSLITSKKSAHESQIEFSNLSINPERVAKVARHKALLHHGPRLANFCQVRHNNQTGRWLTPFRATWHPTRENTLLTGSMERPRRMEVWSTDSNHITLAATLMGEEFASVASLVDVHPSGAVVGANSSGRLHLFA